MLRMPAVADQFYPGEPETLRRLLHKLIPAGPAPAAKALVMPHAGYVYSGGVAGETVSRAAIPEAVIILGPNHHGLGAEAAIMAQGSWLMPLGEVPINADLARLLLAHCPVATDDPAAHRREHSLEVQVPFLQMRQPKLEIVPLVLSHLALPQCLEIGRGIAAAIREYANTYARPALLVASTDMTHYQSRQQATAQDRLAIERVLALDPEGLYHTVREHRISMCGFIPTVITLAATLALGSARAELVRYTDSGEASGDTSQVVGYAGFVID